MLGIDPTSADNRFQYCFYNQFPDKGLPANQLKFFKNVLKDHIPKSVSISKAGPNPQDQPQTLQVPINMDLWLKSYEKNPDPSKFYTTQINSTEDLLNRCSQISGDESNAGALDKASHRLCQILSQLKNVCEKSAIEQQETLDICKQKNIAIQKALIRIFGKFE